MDNGVNDRVVLGLLDRNITKLFKGENLFFLKEDVGTDKDLQLSFHPGLIVESKRPYHLIMFTADQIQTLIRTKSLVMDGFPFRLLIVHGATADECTRIIHEVDSAVTQTICVRRSGPVVERIEKGEVVRKRRDNLDASFKNSAVRGSPTAF